jgi:hypothetical protein
VTARDPDDLLASSPEDLDEGIGQLHRTHSRRHATSVSYSAAS